MGVAKRAYEARMLGRPFPSSLLPGGVASARGLGGFVMEIGQYAGSTLDEIRSFRGGPGYLAWLVERSTVPRPLKATVEGYLKERGDHEDA